MSENTVTHVVPTVAKLDELPDNPMGRKLAAQREIARGVQTTADVMNTEEARGEALRVLRFLGYAPKMKRGPKPKDAPTAPTVTGTATGPVAGPKPVAKPGSK
jgi:hypothetical protein